MKSVEGLNAVAGLQQNVINNQNQQQRQEAAQQAAQLFKSGDIKGAYAAMAAVDPEHATQAFGQFQQLDPNSIGNRSQSQEAGSLKAQNEFGSGSIALRSAQTKANATVQSKQLQNNDKLKSIKLADGSTGYVRESDLQAQLNPNSEDKSPVKVAVPPGQGRTEVDSQGNKVSIGPAQIKSLSSATDKFNAAVKADVEAINSTASSEDITKTNVPGSKVAEKVNTLRGLYKSGRVPQQLIDQYMGTDAGLLTNTEDKISEAEGKGLGPQLRQKIYQFNSALQQTLLQQYDAKLNHFAEQTSENTGIDKFIVKKRFAGEGPTQVQQVTKKVNALDPSLQAVFNKAHDDLFDPNPEVQNKAKQVMQIFKSKYGVSF